MQEAAKIQQCSREFTDMKTQSRKASASTRESAVTQPIHIEENRVILSGGLAAEVTDYIRQKSIPCDAFTAEETLVGVLTAFTAAPLKNLARVEIELPEDLARWGTRTALDLQIGLSDLVRELLEYERYRTERQCIRGGAR
jgi:hypothetical protein